MDARVALAREQHLAAGRVEEHAARCRAMRDQLIRELHAEDPGQYSYGQLAKLVGCSKELVAYICRGEKKTGGLVP